MRSPRYVIISLSAVVLGQDTQASCSLLVALLVARGSFRRALCSSGATVQRSDDSYSPQEKRKKSNGVKENFEQMECAT